MQLYKLFLIFFLLKTKNLKSSDVKIPITAKTVLFSATYTAEPACTTTTLSYLYTRIATQ